MVYLIYSSIQQTSMLVSKQNNYPQQIHHSLFQKQMQLSAYLKYLRLKQPSFVYQGHPFKQTMHINLSRHKALATEVPPYVHSYLQQLREVGEIQNCVGKKIYKKIMQYLEQFPMMGFLIQNVLSQKKLCLSESTLLAHAVDEMVPLFQKILEKIETLKKEAESKKLMELGHRIKHLQYMVNHTPLTNISHVFPPFQPDRVEKYLIMEDNISNAEKKYGRFSVNFNKNKEVFCNLNKVYLQICNDKHQ